MLAIKFTGHLPMGRTGRVRLAFACVALALGLGLFALHSGCSYPAEAQGRAAGSPFSAAMYVVGNPNGRINAVKGTIAADTATSTLYVNTNGRSAWSAFSSLFGGLTGSGTANRVTKFCSATGLCDANATDNGTLFAVLESATIAAGANTAGLAVSSAQTNQTSNVAVETVDGSSATWSVTGGNRVATGLDVTMRTSCTTGQCTPNGMTAIGLNVKADSSGYTTNARCAIAASTTSGPTCPTTGDYALYAERGDVWLGAASGSVFYGPSKTPLLAGVPASGAIPVSNGSGLAASSCTDNGTTISCGAGKFTVDVATGAVTSLAGIGSTGLSSGFSSGSYHWGVDTAGNTLTSGLFTGSGINVATAALVNRFYRTSTAIPAWNCSAGTGATIDARSADWMAKVHSTTSSGTCTFTLGGALPNATSTLCIAFNATSSSAIPQFANSYTTNAAVWSSPALSPNTDYLIQCTFTN